MNNKIGFVLILLFSGFLITGVFYIKNSPVPKDASYVGSQECGGCHTNEYTGWHGSLHPKMMRKVDLPNALVADLQSEDLAFHPDETVWVIGGKWEQQFMGEEEGTETLLPGAWLVKDKKWKNTGWDGWQVPEPLQRCHGCHTVGLNVESGKFVEASVGCESCHGPGSWHSNTAGLGKITSSIDAQICGQCHTRGRSVDGQYFFAEGYKPGLKLTDYFKEEEPDYIQNSSKWWGNGHARKRHQEYYSWRQGGHVNSLKSLKEGYNGKYGEVTSKCLSCHAGEAINDGQSEDYKLDEVEYGITCAVCHNSHGNLDKPRLTCLNCHEEGGFYHQPQGNESHVPCPKDANIQCQQCHMPLTVMNGGDYTLHSHRAGIIPPSDTRKFGVPNSCANGSCHSDKNLEWQEEMFVRFYSRDRD